MEEKTGGGLELQLTSPANSRDLVYRLTGLVRAPQVLDGGSVRIRSLITGLTDEAFLDDHGGFTQDVELQPESDNPLELTVCDGAGTPLVRVEATVRHQSGDKPAAQQHGGPLQVEYLQRPEVVRGLTLDPPWPRFAQLVRRCLDVAVTVAKSTNRDREELFGYVHAQERYAEKAYEEHNQPLYRECRDNLEKYAGYLDDLLRGLPGSGVLAAPGPPTPSHPPEEEARDSFDRFRALLASVWKQVKARRRTDLDQRLKEIAGQAGGLSQRLKTDPAGVIRDVRRLATEVGKVEGLLEGNRRPAPGDDAGLLEGSR